MRQVRTMLQISITLRLRPIALKKPQLPRLAKFLQIPIQIPRIDALTRILRIIERQLLNRFIIILPTIRFHIVGRIDVIDIEIRIVDDYCLIKAVIFYCWQTLGMLATLFCLLFGFHQLNYIYSCDGIMHGELYLLILLFLLFWVVGFYLLGKNSMDCTFMTYFCVDFYNYFIRMYGGGYGSYGSYGGYGGYSGMGSSYGSYGGLGSSYPSSLGSYGGLNRAGSLNANQPNQPGNEDPNRPAEPINQRKLVIEEYFKMMGGLRSMVEIGFSMVALCNFTSRSWELLKKIVGFLAKTSKKLIQKLSGTHILTQKMTQAFDKAMMLSPNSKNGNTLLNKILVAVRITAAIVLLIGIKLKGNLNKQVESEHDAILKKYQEVKKEEERLKEQEEREALELELEGFGEDQWHQKEGYF